MTTKDPVAVIQEAVDLTAIGSELDGILAQIREGDAAIHRAKQIVDDWRVKAGQRFTEVRNTIPERGPKAKKWGEFVEARGVSLDTAANYMKLAEYAAANPDAVISGKTVVDVYRELGIKKDFPNQFGKSLPTANYTLDTTALPKKEEPKPAKPPPVDLNAVNRTDLWHRFMKGELTNPEGLERRKTWGDALLEADEEIRKEYRAAVKAARVAGRADPPMPPMPASWLTAGAKLPQAADPVAAARKALEAAEQLGREAVTRPALMIGALVQRLRQAGHLVPAGQDSSVYRAYQQSREQAVAARIRESLAPAPGAPAVDPRQAALPLAEPPRPAPYVPLFDDSPLAAGASADDEDEEEEVQAERDAARVEIERLTQHRDRLVAERDEAQRQRDQALRDLAELRDGWELAARERVAGADLRDRLAAAEARAQAAEASRDVLADEVRRLRQDADACGLVTCEAEADDGDPCARVALPCAIGPALCARHQSHPSAAAFKPPLTDTWEPRSCGGAKAVHAVTPKDSDGNPPALCGQRPSYSSKGWTPRPGTPITCTRCQAAIAAGAT